MCPPLPNPGLFVLMVSAVAVAIPDTIMPENLWLDPYRGRPQNLGTPTVYAGAHRPAGAVLTTRVKYY